MSKQHIRIGHVLPWPSVGGVELATLAIAKTMESRGVESVAFCLENSTLVSDLFVQKGFATEYYRPSEHSYRHPKNYLAASVQLARRFKKHNVDLVHCGDLLAAYYAGLAAKMAGVPVLCHIRCAYPEISKRDQSFLRLVSKFVFVSQDAWRTFAYKVRESRGSVLYEGIDIAALVQQAKDAESVRSEFNIPADVELIGMAARVAPAKDYETLAKAAARVVAQRKNVRFVVVGDHSHVREYREHYETVKGYLNSNGVADYFIFTDHRDDAQRLIAALDIFILSTRTEGLPLVILEAMAHAKPVVATNVGGVSEVVDAGVTGLLHAPKDDVQQAADLLRLLEDASLRQKMGEAGRQRVMTKFNKERFAAELGELYYEMLGRRPEAPLPAGLENQGVISNECQ
ncbi:MAG TPA: glycosyltransferase family 4 protein [Pyrinomonadaceae bacterium]|nr:glycosyltransferase family 4 protein [Pyrinomonadaceae bacterium]